MNKIIGAGILAIDKNTGKILLCRRGLDGGHPNTWATFGGTFEESDGTPKQTAKREFWEETSINDTYDISIEPFYLNTNKFLDFYTYLGIFKSQPEVIINEESLGYGWFDLENIPYNLIPGFNELLDKKGEELKEIITILLNEKY
jgi:8-oxo-dGTP pyrophosphatase MutT (NUDIX family)